MLAARAAEVSREALASGALQPIATRSRIVEDGGLHFVVRQVSSLARKAEARAQTPGQRGNPFLPYDEALYVADLSDTHLCLLNKFQVMSAHLLIVTRAFEAQTLWLTPADFAALAVCLGEIDGLGFYNAGAEAGASEPHRHLQIVPPPFAAELPGIPVAPVVEAACRGGAPAASAALPFRHSAIRLDPPWENARDSRDALVEGYRKVLRHAGLLASGEPLEGRQSAPYNLLVTRRWMLLVPRTREHFETISVNALGFAGSLLVRDEAALGRVVSVGPLRVLAHVARSRA